MSKGQAQIAQKLGDMLFKLIPQNPNRPVTRDHNSGGVHKFGGKTHHYRSGRGLGGNHWECANPNCAYYDQASLYNTIASWPGCCQKCDLCGDWIYNARQTCPNAPKVTCNSSKQQTFNIINNIHQNLTEAHNKAKLNHNNSSLAVFRSFHGTHLRGTPEKKVDLSKNNQEWEKWKWLWVSGSTFHWQSCHGTYLRAHSDGRVDLSSTATPTQLWTKIQRNGKLVWKSHYGTYLRAYPDGRVDLAKQAKEREEWRD